ncbi:MAG: response regulator [Anaerolineae bacterium]|nr:response regulator [Anaerolineae bacterium]
MARVLYIEDDDKNRLLVERVLLAEGYDVVSAASARLGIQMAEIDPPDIILMDINMPGMDGFMATAALRAIPHLRHIPIVAVTANVMKGDMEGILAAGCDGYIPKPIDVDRFPEEVDYFLQNRNA